MLDIKIPKEIRGYDVKTFGPFTTRQAICFVIGAIGAVGVYGLLKHGLGLVNPPLLPSVIAAAPALYMGWGESYYHMKPEDYNRYIFIPNKKRRVVRKYVTEGYNPVAKMYKKELKKKTLTEKESKRKKTKNEKMVIPADLRADLQEL